MNLFNFLKQTVDNDDSKSAMPEGYCPNCWGRQEYGGRFYESIKTEGINTNNIDQKKGWVQAYAEKNITGIQLRADDAQLVCDSCNIRYELKQ